MVGGSVFASNIILPFFSFFFLIIDLYFSIPAIIRQTFIVVAELAIPTGTPTNEAKTEIETHSVTVEAK